MSPEAKPGENRVWSERWGLAALGADELIRLGFAALILGMIFVMFHLLGNTNDTKVYGRSALLWMVSRWNDSGIALGSADYSHGWLIPAASLAIVWWKRKALAEAPRSVCWTGLLVVVLALLLHWVGARAQQTRLSLFALVVLSWGVPFYLFGWPTARILMFPCAYLLFCIPMNFLDSLTVPLRIYMTIAVNFLLNGLGFHYVRSGTALHSIQGGFGLEVADPCSGIRSLTAMVAITAVYGYLTQPTLLKKWIMFLSAVPLALIGNMFRILTIALVSEAFGSELGAGLYHEFSGYVIFMAITIPLMVLFGNLLDYDYRKAWHQWKTALLSPTS